MILEAALANFSRWNTTEPLLSPPEVISHINWGTAHQAIHVRGETDKGTQDFVVRFLSRADATLALAFEEELNSIQNAAEAGVAPRPVFSSADSHLLVTEYIGTQADSVTAQQLASLLNTIHQLPHTQHVLNLQAQLARYTQFALDKHVPRDELVDPLYPPLSKAFATLQAGPQVMCHNDLGVGNVFIGDDRMLAIDWEYSGVGNPYFDIASALVGWPEIDPDSLLDALQIRGFDAIQWRCAKAVHAALEWNWYKASAAKQPPHCTYGRVKDILLALP